MFFKTPKNSETGKKFIALFEEMKSVNDQALELAESLGGETFRPFSFAGGISSIVFADAHQFDNPLNWRNVNKRKNEFMPRAHRKEGKEIMKKIEALPTLHREKFGEVLGVRSFWKSPGVKVAGDWILIEVYPEWRDTIPKDCIEILHSEYLEIEAACERKEATNA